MKIQHSLRIIFTAVSIALLTACATHADLPARLRLRVTWANPLRNCVDNQC